jgi:cytochrome bd ubiquinol oxidase subunit II
MQNYETLRVIWWLILGVLLIGFAVTDGFDMGVCAIFRFVGRTDEEHRALLESVEPVWEGNQVWFILGGGAAFAAWPLLYAASFSSLYLAMFLVLAGFIMRPVGFSFRGKIANQRWRDSCDLALLVAGVVPALLFGVAFGNLFIGIPFHFDSMMRPVYTGGFFNLLHPFALLCGVVSLSMLVMHGASYAAFKVAGQLGSRSAGVSRFAALVFVAAFVVAGILIFASLDGQRITSNINGGGPSNPLLKTVILARGAWLENFVMHPMLWSAPAGAIAAALLTNCRHRAVPVSAAIIDEPRGQSDDLGRVEQCEDFVHHAHRRHDFSTRGTGIHGLGLSGVARPSLPGCNSAACGVLLIGEGAVDVVLQLDTGTWLRAGVRRFECHVVRIRREPGAVTLASASWHAGGGLANGGIRNLHSRS